MKTLTFVLIGLITSFTSVVAGEIPRIVVIDSSMPTEALSAVVSSRHPGFPSTGAVGLNWI